jgi:hypothetical protein
MKRKSLFRQDKTKTWTGGFPFKGRGPPVYILYIESIEVPLEGDI